jgi:hypothetical protein
MPRLVPDDVPDDGTGNESIIAALIDEYCANRWLRAALQDVDPVSVRQDGLNVACPRCGATGVGPREPCSSRKISFPQGSDTLVWALGKEYLEHPGHDRI